MDLFLSYSRWWSDREKRMASLLLNSHEMIAWVLFFFCCQPFCEYKLMFMFPVCCRMLSDSSVRLLANARALAYACTIWPNEYLNRFETCNELCTTFTRGYHRLAECVWYGWHYQISSNLFIHLEYRRKIPTKKYVRILPVSWLVCLCLCVCVLYLCVRWDVKRAHTIAIHCIQYLFGWAVARLLFPFAGSPRE